MAWLTEFGQVMYQSAHLEGVAPGGSLEAARAALLAGDPKRLLDAFPDGGRIDDPRAGRVQGRAALEAYCEASRA